MKDQQTFPANFGELLKAFRKRKRMTQQQLAQRLGVHINTISSWELGTYLPATRGLILELARHLALDEQESRQLLEASLTALSPHWLISSPRNPLFTGREEVLEILHAYLGAEHAAAFTQSYALYGLGGVGKTQIALEYAYRYALEYSAVFWIGPETLGTVASSMLHIAELLQLPVRREKDHPRVVSAVQRWLVTHSRWLLIWDNLEDLELLQRWQPAARQGAILITTRNPALGTLAQGLELSTMRQEEGMLFLLKRAKVLEAEATSEQIQQLAQRQPGEYAAAEKLVRVMDGLPLALDQAGAYIEEIGCSLANYLQRYEQQSAHLLDRRGALAGDHPHSVTATFLTLIERVEREQPAAADVLRVCALLHAEEIPEELFVMGAAQLGPELADLASDPRQLDLAIAALRSLSLVQRQAQTRTLSLHPLVQTVLREWMGMPERAMWMRRVSAALNRTFPEVTYEAWEQCERLLPHVLACATAMPDQGGNQELAEVLRKAADYLCECARYDQAEALYERAMRIREQGGRSGYREVATSLRCDRGP